MRQIHRKREFNVTRGRQEGGTGSDCAESVKVFGRE